MTKSEKIEAARLAIARVLCFRSLDPFYCPACDKNEVKSCAELASAAVDAIEKQEQTP